MVSTRVLLLTALLGAVEAQKVSRNSRCGRDFGLTCAGSRYGNCCSQYGYCGSGNAYCAASNNCQKGYGSCDGQSPPKSSAVASPYQSAANPSTVTVTVSGQPTTCPAISKSTVTVTSVSTFSLPGLGQITTVTVPATVTLPGAVLTSLIQTTVTESAVVTTLTVPTTVTQSAEVTTLTVPTTVTISAEVTTVSVPTTVTLSAEVTTVSVPTTLNSCAPPSPSVTQAVVNPSFETNDAWTLASGIGTLAYVDGNQNTGSRALQLTATLPVNLAASFSQTVTLFPGAVYSLSLYAKANVASNCYVSATLGSTPLTIAGSVLSTSYTQKTATYYPVAGVTEALLRITGNCGQANVNPRTVNFDDVTLSIIGYYQSV
ncbi:Nn.00g104820.m01.CDS01 [Neocucurbitaria sp. VM-36]